LRRFFCARNKYTHYMSCGDCSRRSSLANSAE